MLHKATVHTSSRFCWVSCSLSAYARIERRSRVSFLPVRVGACGRFGIALLAFSGLAALIWEVQSGCLRRNSDGSMARCTLTSSYPTLYKE